MKNNECKESFIDKSFSWMLMFAKCVDFASLKSSRNLEVLDYIMNEEMIVAKHVDFIKEKVICLSYYYCDHVCYSVMLFLLK